jgi:hypothetical protein
MGPHDDEVWAEVGRLLSARPGWALEGRSTPGEPPVWCFGDLTDHTLEVNIDGGELTGYVVERDRVVPLADTGAMIEWIDGAEVRYPIVHSHVAEVGRHWFHRNR